MGNVDCKKMVDQATVHSIFNASRRAVLAYPAGENLFTKKL